MTLSQSDFDEIAVDGHRFHALGDGPDTLRRLLALIDGAQRELRLLYYIFSADGAGTAVRDALLAAMARGVAVALMIDDFGSEGVDREFFDPLQQAGARICNFHPRWGRRYLLRNHQKMAIADNDRVIIGGFNIEDSYFRDGDEDAWRDFGIEVQGPSIQRLIDYYEALFRWSMDRRATLRGMRRLIRRASTPEGRVRWLIGGPTLRPSHLVRTLRDDLRKASRLDMIMAYFSPNPAMLRRLVGVARRGKARIITAARSDNRTTIGAARHCYHRLLNGGVEIHEYQPQKLHEKLIALDNVGYVGSANFDMRSLYLNLEIMLRVEDAAFAGGVRARIDREQALSERIDRERYSQLSSPWAKLKWTIDYFIVTTLDFGVSRGLNGRG
jgi:cardiolipin synthase